MNPEQVIQIHTFKVDVTPPRGDYLLGGLHGTAVGVETPLFLRGMVIRANATRYVLGCIDYCYLSGRSHQRFVQALASAAAVPAQQVALHSNHVHDAPLINEEPHALVERYNPGLRLHNEAHFSNVLNRVQQEIMASLAEPGIPVIAAAFSSHPVQEFASNRRVIGENNKCHIRYSICGDPNIRSQPVGLIDPMLDQITLYGENGGPAICLNFYASHPQVSDGRGLISGDTIAVAMDLFEHETPDVFGLYFTGCAGDVTAGKYTTEDRVHNQALFGKRLFEAMQKAHNKASPRWIESMNWTNATVELPLSSIDKDQEYYISRIRQSASTAEKYLAALKLNRLQKGDVTYPFGITRIRLGHINMLLLPAEMCVEYQIYAKSRCDGDLVVAAYGDCFLSYVATDEAFEQGGYEVQPEWTEVGPGIESIIKGQIDRILSRRL